ncbi:MAG: hypothetical protein CMJ32_07650 [Phycisphaerae bacterium]|nr:hypothetical protein [Phycisphaerae bacterium]
MLVLFDIDGTILETYSAGRRALIAAMNLVRPGHDYTLDGVQVSGRLDPLILGDLAAKYDVEVTPEIMDRFREAYGADLGRQIQSGQARIDLLPGVSELVGIVHEWKDVTLGLLTGNWPETGALKIRTAGLDPSLFTVCAWGSDAPNRPGLIPVALEKYAESIGGDLENKHVIVIGDTPHDIDCASSNGCRSLAVATGRFTLEELSEHDPDLAVQDLSDTSMLADWMQGFLETDTDETG